MGYKKVVYHSRSFEIGKTRGGPIPPASRNQSVAVPETVDKIGSDCIVFS